MLVANTLPAVVIIFILAGCSFLAKRILGNNSQPVVIHNFVWSLSLIIFSIGLISYEKVPIQSWLLFTGGLLAFNIGAICFRMLPKKKNVAFSATPSETEKTTLLTKKYFYVLMALFGIGLLGYLLTIQFRFGLETFITHPATIRGAKNPSYLESVPVWSKVFLYLGPILFALLLIPGSIAGKISLRLRVGLVIVLGVGLLLLLQRANLFMGIAFFCAAYLMVHQGMLKFSGRNVQKDNTFRRFSKFNSFSNFWKSPKPLTVILIALAGAVISFILVGIALGKTGSDSTSFAPILRLTGLQNPVHYITSGIPAFLNLTESTNLSWPPSFRPVVGNFNPQTWGAATFESFLSQIPSINHWNPISPFFNVGKEVNTNIYTWFEPLYRDFRIPGVLVGSALLGTLITYLHSLRWKSPMFFWLSAIMVSSIFFAPEAPKYLSTGYLVSITLVVLIWFTPILLRIIKLRLFKKVRVE